MNNFGKRSSERRFDNRNKGRSEMFPATCTKCGKNCEVPFRPSSGKPIYCSNCFEDKGGRGNERFEKRDFGRRDFGDRHEGRSEMHQATCDECGKNCEVPFRLTPGKPIYCHECFGNKGKPRGNFTKSGIGETDEKLKKQLDMMNAKLDQILNYFKQDKIKSSAPKDNISPEVLEIKEIKSIKAVKKTVAKKKKKKDTSEVKAQSEPSVSEK